MATGGIARIHVGHRRSDRRPVALKVFLPPEGNERRFLDYMVHEARALQQVATAPAVVSLLDHGLWLGRPALALEWLDGHTLGEVMATSGALSLERVEHVMRQLLRAVTALHAHGVIHGDLNAANVMLCTDDALGERVRLVDFGAAQVNGVGIGACDEVIGTPGYVAPELVDGGVVSPSTDVYALGVLLFEMLTGRPPFPGTEMLDVMYRQTRGRIPRPSTVRGAGSEISEALDALVTTALAPSPSRRFPDVSLLRAAFEEAILVTARTRADGERSPVDTVDEPTLRCRRPVAAAGSTP